MSAPDLSNAPAGTDLDPEGKSSPAAGCIILATIVVVFGGLVVLYATRGLWMNREIDKFTVAEPVATAIAEPTSAEAAAVSQKLEQIRDAALNNRTEHFTLDADELNNLIASRAILSDLRGTVYVESISKDAITTRVTQTLRSLKPGTFRYLNGTIDFVPVLRRKTIVFQIRDIRVDGAEIPQAFIESYSSQDLFKLDTNNATLSDTLRGLERVLLEDGQVIIDTRTRTAATPEKK